MLPFARVREGLSRLADTLRPVPARRRRSRMSPESLESRVLLAVDLAISNVQLTFIDTSNPNAVSYGVSVEIINLGDTPVNLAGDPGVLADNVGLQAFASTDEVLGGDVAAGGVVVVTDPGSAILGQFETFSRGLGGTLNNLPDTSFILIQVDSGNSVAESNENNNVFVLDLTLPHLLGSGQQGVQLKKLTAIDSSVEVFDLDTTNFNGGGIDVSNLGDEPTDQFRIIKSGKGADRLRAAGKNLKLGKQVIGTISGGKKGEPLQINFTAQVDEELANRVLQSIGFRAKKQDPQAREVQIVMRDDLGQEGPAFVKQLNVN